MQTRLQRRHDKESLRQAGKYIALTLIGLVLIVKFGLPALIRLATFIGGLRSSNQPIETATTLPPSQPVLTALPEATSSGKITVAGYSAAGVVVRLFRDGLNLDDTITDTNGDFQFKDVILKPGENGLYTQAETATGVKSEPSRTFTVYFDDDAPSLNLDQPESGQSFFDADSPITVSGTTEPEARVTINGKFVRVDGDGAFSASWPLNPGDNQLDLVSTDRAGNITSQSLTVNYTP